jgi:hypothetical protein
MVASTIVSRSARRDARTRDRPQTTDMALAPDEGCTHVACEAPGRAIFAVATPVAKEPRMTRPDIRMPDPAPDVATGRSPLDISVIVPTYERPEALAVCLEALARQTVPRERFEVIVCDDGSSTAVADRQADLVSRLAGHLDVRLLHQANAGTGTFMRSHIALSGLAGYRAHG